MGRVICKKRCFHRGRIWEPGEPLAPQPGPGESYNTNFVDEDAYKKPPEPPPEPETFSEINEKLKKEEEELFKGRIHEDKPTPPKPVKSRGRRSNRKSKTG